MTNITFPNFAAIMKATSKTYPSIGAAKKGKRQRKSFSQLIVMCASCKASFTKQLAAYLMIFLIALITVNSAFNLHTHVLNDGTTITHAHPYKNGSTNNNNHDHSDLEYLHLSFLLTFNFEISHSLTIIPEAIIADYQCQNAGIYRIFQKRINTNKAPPSKDSFLA